jgi:hypothetical protein
VSIEKVTPEGVLVKYSDIVSFKRISYFNRLRIEVYLLAFFIRKQAENPEVKNNKSYKICCLNVLEVGDEGEQEPLGISGTAFFRFGK